MQEVRMAVAYIDIEVLCLSANYPSIVSTVNDDPVVKDVGLCILRACSPIHIKIKEAFNNSNSVKLKHLTYN